MMITGQDVLSRDLAVMVDHVALICVLEQLSKVHGSGIFSERNIMLNTATLVTEKHLPPSRQMLWGTGRAGEL